MFGPTDVRLERSADGRYVRFDQHQQIVTEKDALFQDMRVRAEDRLERLKAAETKATEKDKEIAGLVSALEEIAALKSVVKAADGLPSIVMRDEEMREIAKRALDQHKGEARAE